METKHKKENAIKIIKILLASAILLFACMAIVWFEMREKQVVLVALGAMIITVLSVTFIFLRFVVPLMICIDKEVSTRNFLEKKYIDILKNTQQLATAVEQTPDSIIMTDTQGEILYVNPAFCQITGYTAIEAMRKKPSLVKSGKTSPEVYQDLWKTILSGRVWRGELQNKKKDGTFFWEDTSIAPILDENGLSRGFVGIRKNVTEQKAHAKALRHLTGHLEEMVQERTAKLNKALSDAKAANRAKSDFLANMSHELRTPLHAIKGFATMILKKSTALMQDLDGIKDPETLRYLSETLHLNHTNWEKQTHFWLTRILENQGRQLKLIDDLLDLAKLESGKRKFQFRQEDLLKSIHGCVDELDPLFKEKGIQLTIVPNNGDSEAYFDPEQLQGVIKNLLSNALKFTGRDGHITLSLNDGCVDGMPTLEIKVQDNGQGIPEQELDLIFEPFVQSSNISIHSGGSGLGLSICREVVTAHGGTITASNHPNGGAIFTVVLAKNNP